MVQCATMGLDATARLARLAEVFDAIGSRTVWVGDRPGFGHRRKLAATPGSWR
jgi:hypothetical protein